MMTHSRPQAIVVGAGIVGLTSAICLQHAGWKVRIWAAEAPTETVSAIAAALWYPYRVFPENRVRTWSAAGLERFLSEAGEAPGVRIAIGRLLWRGERPSSTRDIPMVRDIPDSALPVGYAGGCEAELPVIEMPKYLAHLASRVVQDGGTIERRQLASLQEACDHSRVVVNASGLGARSLSADDTVTPIRGQVVRVRNPGLTRFVVDIDAPSGATYVVPRSDDCVLGGTADEGAWDRDPDMATAARIIERCEILELALRPVHVLEHKVGLRPGRPSVRLEPEFVGRSTVIHNYGHGGAGVTVAWGCAADVVRLAADLD